MYKEETNFTKICSILGFISTVNLFHFNYDFFGLYYFIIISPYLSIIKLLYIFDFIIVKKLIIKSTNLSIIIIYRFVFQ